MTTANTTATATTDCEAVKSQTAQPEATATPDLGKRDVRSELGHVRKVLANLQTYLVGLEDYLAKQEEQLLAATLTASFAEEQKAREAARDRSEAREAPRKLDEAAAAKAAAKAEKAEERKPWTPIGETPKGETKKADSEPAKSPKGKGKGKPASKPAAPKEKAKPAAAVKTPVLRSSKTKVQLIKLAKANKVTVPADASKAKLVELLAHIPGVVAQARRPRKAKPVSVETAKSAATKTAKSPKGKAEKAARREELKAELTAKGIDYPAGSSCKQLAALLAA